MLEGQFSLNSWRHVKPFILKKERKFQDGWKQRDQEKSNYMAETKNHIIETLKIGWMT